MGQGRLDGQGGRRRRARRRHRDPPQEPGTALVRLGRRHARLVHLPAVVVGPSHPDMARPRRADGVPGPRRDAAAGLGTGPRRARHLVLLGAVAVLHHGLARPHARPGEVLPHQCSGHRLRHPLLLGGAHGHVRHLRLRGRRDHRGRRPRKKGPPGPVRERLPARPDPRRARPQDEQVPRQRHRPAGLGGTVRRRCAALHPGPRREPRRGPVHRRGPRQGVAKLRHQTVQRHPLRPDERRRPGGAAARRRPDRRRPLDPRPARGGPRGG